jgi:hypothetical protein
MRSYGRRLRHAHPPNAGSIAKQQAYQPKQIKCFDKQNNGESKKV